MSRIQNTLIRTARSVISRVPSRWLPGAQPDHLIGHRTSLGRPVSRVDGDVKVTGQARFAAEIPLDGLVHAAFVHSRITRGRIRRIDTTATEAAPGVVLVMTHHNAPRLEPPPTTSLFDLGAAGNHSLAPMQDDEIRWNGQVVAVVLAETREQADHAAHLLDVEYERWEARTRFEEAKADARTLDSVMLERNPETIGDPRRLLADAAVSIDRTYTTPPLNHNAIELHACTVHWDGDRLLVHDATQLLNAVRTTLAKVFGIDAEQVHVSSPFVGGGFGAKGLWDHQILAIGAARLAGRPVRAVLSREGVYRIIGGRTGSEQRVALGADRTGRLRSVTHTGYSVMPRHAITEEQFSASSRNLYRSDSFEIGQRHLDLDVVANTFMRAPGEAIGTFALESAIDELAHELGMDPIELRRRNEPERHPTTGLRFSQRDLILAYQLGAERFGWHRRSATPGLQRDGEWLVGMGCASGTFPYARMPGATVRLTLGADGRAVLASAAHEMGMGTATVQAQHAADRLGLPVDSVRFELGHTDLPTGTMAGGSSQTMSLAGAVAAVADDLRSELVDLVGPDSPLSGLKARDLVLSRGGLGASDRSDRWESYGAILQRAGRREVTVTSSGSMPLELFKYAMGSSSAIFAEVRVSEVTGEVRVARLVGSFDCGRILNPTTATSQFKGAMIMGLGLALTERTLLDERTGRIMNPSLSEYHIPTHLDVPELEVMWTDVPDPRTPLGARGIGEIGVAGVAAAIANAVFNATGRRVRDLPITLDKVLVDGSERAGEARPDEALEPA